MRWLYICSIKSVANRRAWVSLTGEWKWRNWDPAGIPSGYSLDACNPRASDWHLGDQCMFMFSTQLTSKQLGGVIKNNIH